MKREDLDTAATELRQAELYRRLVMLACVSYVECRAEQGDELARGLAGLVADADKRSSVAKLNAMFALPHTVCENDSHN